MLASSVAYSIASQWGSLITTGDPGSVFYSFPCGDARPASESHRDQCLTYIDRDLIPLAEDRVKRTYNRRHGKRAHEHSNAIQDLAELRVLRDFFCAAPLRESAH